MTTLLRPLQFAFRRLLRAPSFTTIAGLTLAIGIGATAAIFSVVDGILLKPLAYDRPESLVSVGHATPGLNYDVKQVCDALYFVYRSENRTFEDIGLWRNLNYAVTGDFEPDQVRGIGVSEPVLRMLGARPEVGRVFTAADDAPKAGATVVLSYAYWQRRFGGKPSAVGSSLVIDGQPTTVIGVLPKPFHFLDEHADLYLPLRLDPAAARLINFNWWAIGRLKPGVVPAAASADLSRLIFVAAERYAGTGLTMDQLRSARMTAIARPLKVELVGSVSAVLWVLMASVGLILLLACANVANLFLVQAEGRQREMAVRTALGAGRRALIGDLLTESALLGLVAGFLGLVLASAGLQILRAVGPTELPRLDEIRVDWTVIGFTAAVSLLASLSCGLYPALRFGHQSPLLTLKEGGRTAGPSRKQHRIRNGLVVVQIALALVLLIGSGLMIRTVRSLRRVDPGFHGAASVVTFRVVAPPVELPDERLGATYAAIFERLRSIPGVKSVTAMSDLPFPPDDGSNTVPWFEGEPRSTNQIPPLRHYVWAYPGLEETLQIPLVAGRSVTWSDLHARAKVVVVSENLAREKWGSPEAALGKRVGEVGLDVSQPPRDWYEIVGVLKDVRYAGVDRPAPTIIYWPGEMENFMGLRIAALRSGEIAVRFDRPATAAVAKELQEAVWAVNAHLPVAELTTMAEMLSRSMARPAFAMLMLGIAAIVALVLGLVGIYAVVSFIVAERTREIGLRIALGAEPGRVRRMVIGQASAVAGVGIGIGLAIAAGLTKGMAGIIYGVGALDPLTYGVVAVGLGLVAMAASWLPARRAARLDPIRALRQD
jgi:predicted permease